MRGLGAGLGAVRSVRLPRNARLEQQLTTGAQRLGAAAALVLALIAVLPAAAQAGRREAR